MKPLPSMALPHSITLVGMKTFGLWLLWHGSISAWVWHACEGLGELRELDESNFNVIVDGHRNVLVEFYEPECAHCQRVEPEFFATAQALEFEESIVLARVDTKECPQLKKLFGIEGHPVFKWFPVGSTDAQKFHFVHYTGRMANTFLKMIGERMGKSFPELPLEVSKVKQIKAEDFDRIVLEVGRPAFVVLYIPWTEEKRVADALDQTAKLFEDVATVAKLGIERIYERDIADRYNCKLYPCYYLFDANNVKHEFSEGPFDDVRGYARFLNYNLGTERDPSWLDERAMAGRLPELDKLLSRPDRVAAIEAVETSSLETKAYYLKTAKRIDAEGHAFLLTEAERLAALLNKARISAGKRRQFAERKNVLSAFIHAVKEQGVPSPRDDL